MLNGINRQFNAAKKTAAEDQFIAESVLAVDEVIPGSEEEFDDLVDVDSVPDDVYKKVDKALDDLIGDENYDDTEVEELVDDDDIGDEELDAVIDEACNAWYDNEGINHPNTDLRYPNTKPQPKFDVNTSVADA